MKNLFIALLLAAPAASAQRLVPDPAFARLPGQALRVADSLKIDLQRLKIEPPLNPFPAPKGGLILYAQWRAVWGFDSLGKRLWSKEWKYDGNESNSRADRPEVGEITALGWDAGDRAIDLSLVMLLAGSLALGTALEKTGITVWLGELLGSLGGTLGPRLVFAAFLLGAILLSELMSNSGTVLLLAPIALTTATQLGLNPTAMIAAVVFGSSIAFALPMGYQTSLMILVPGGYRVRDFVRVGLPLDFLLGGLACWLIPLQWPLLLPPG